MKKKISITFILFFLSFTSLKANDISEFEIEGMTIGDSLLDHFTKEEIINPKNKFFYPNSKKIYELALDLRSELYDEIQFSLKQDDNEYKIYNINGIIYYKQNFNRCLKQKKEIELTLSKIFNSNQIAVLPESGPHPGDTTGRSNTEATWYVFKSEDHVGVVCTDWHQDMNLEDSLKVLITSKEYNDFLLNEAY